MTAQNSSKSLQRLERKDEGKKRSHGVVNEPPAMCPCSDGSDWMNQTTHGFVCFVGHKRQFWGGGVGLHPAVWHTPGRW